MTVRGATIRCNQPVSNIRPQKNKAKTPNSSPSHLKKITLDKIFGSAFLDGAYIIRTPVILEVCFMHTAAPVKLGGMSFWHVDIILLGIVALKHW